ncbi:MAG: DNA polymerase III subunit delta' [Nitrospirae bacterium]|nr:DNA polymerase III subunit delta' [Nitrospirota bacterium]
MTFSTIEGHERSIRTLQRAIANNALAHAYLFSGQEGIGKKRTALALAAAVNCLHARPEGGCGECPSCRKVEKLCHPDVHLLVPDGDEIKIDQIRQVQADFALKPFEGTKKVLIVDNTESMNAAASNAFLKTLEEPPGDALIILITAMPQSLLPTIRSRCQEITFHPLPRNILARELVHTRGLSEEDAWFIAGLAQGSMGRGLEMDIEQEKSARDEVATLWSGLAQMGPGEALALAETIAKDRERFERLIEIGIEWLRDALVYRETGEERLLVHAPAQHQYRQLADGHSLPRLLADMELFTASRELLDRRVSAQLVAENLFLKFGRG